MTVRGRYEKKFGKLAQKELFDGIEEAHMHFLHIWGVGNRRLLEGTILGKGGRADGG